MFPPNILITNYCNQNCSFCFARAEMNTKTIDREMELINFKRILIKMKSLRIDTVKLLGGEPMLHSRLDQILALSLAHFPYVQIFSNGIFSDDKAMLVSKYFPRIKFTFNVTTPGFQLNQKIRQRVIRHITDFALKTEVTLSLTIDITTDIDFVVKTITKKVLRSAKHIRIGFSNPTAGKKNYYSFNQFPMMGKQLYKFIKTVRDAKTHAQLHLNCGFTRCMFTDEEYNYLTKQGLQFLGWGCFGKGSSMDIATNMSAFHCFPLSTKHRLSLTAHSLVKIDQTLMKKRYDYWGKINQKVCQKCPFYGHVPSKCPGPCIAFIINGVNNQSKSSS